ncbi:MAG: argininosuccinate lyase [Bacteroidales bacterium]|nr:argininosuccinate lyase [Bacteroidales bacterium]MCF8390968.1 argininosuccinate lyase [Bacteroidales bacterium]
MKLWEKGIKTKEVILEFTSGEDRILDLRLAKDDVIASMAHSAMLGKVGLLTETETRDLINSLLEIFYAVGAGTFEIEPGMEDVHSQVEKILTQKLGDTGKKVHTARSRNDQVITDLKLYYRSEIISIVEKLKFLVEKLLLKSDENADVEIPGYTHFQAAMPSSFGLWFGAYAESLTEDLQALSGTFRYINQNPLGSAAGYGSSFPIDRQFTTELLEFDDLHINSVNAQLSRGKSEKLMMSGISGIAGSLSKMAMDMVLFMNQNFNLMGLNEEFTTGSSIMPHKKNPDVLELIRAKANRIQAKETEVLLLINNLPSGYHRDFQLLKEICFPAIDDVNQLLQIMTLVVDNVEMKEIDRNDEKYKYLATVDSINEKVIQGTAFRDAYKEVAEEISEGKYKAGKKITHSHIGSIGNTGSGRIMDKLIKEISFFQLEKYSAFDNNFINRMKSQYNV